MLNGKKIVVVMPAYNAAKTLAPDATRRCRATSSMSVILVDDASQDQTVAIAQRAGHQSRRPPDEPRLRGAIRKPATGAALEIGADIVVMVHPDYQYTPKLITAMAAMIAYGVYHARARVADPRQRRARRRDAALQVRRQPLSDLDSELCLPQKLSEYHTGYRAFSREVLLKLPLDENSDDFVFDNEMIVQLVYFGYEIAEITCPTKYFEEASSINFWRSITLWPRRASRDAALPAARAGLKIHPTLSQSGRRS